MKYSGKFYDMQVSMNKQSADFYNNVVFLLLCV